MFDLPSVTNEELERIEEDIRDIKRGSRKGHLRPHKFVMLLAVIEMADLGLLLENKIYPRDPLLTVFENVFGLVKKKDDLCQPGPPFFHLRTSGFWFHKIRDGREQFYAELTTTGGGLQRIQDNI